MRPLIGAALVLALCAATGAPSGAPRELPLTPETAEIGFRAFAFGIVPMDGTFARFHGSLHIDPAAPGHCDVQLTVETASLRMSSRAVQDEALSSNLLDAASFPTIRYTGACRDGAIAGTLTLHGVTLPLELATMRDGPRYVAQSSLRRAEWGITGRPLQAGRTIRLRISLTLPPS